MEDLAPYTGPRSGLRSWGLEGPVKTSRRRGITVASEAQLSLVAPLRTLQNLQNASLFSSVTNKEVKNSA